MSWRTPKRDGRSWVFDTTGRAVLDGKGAKEMGIS